VGAPREWFFSDMKFSLYLERDLLEKRLLNEVEINNLILQWCDYILAEMEYEQKLKQAERLKGEIPKLKEELEYLTSLENESENDLSWMDNRVDELEMENRKLLEHLRRAKR
jgi:cell division septum initiation protein DivIVA